MQKIQVTKLATAIELKKFTRSYCGQVYNSVDGVHVCKGANER